MYKFISITKEFQDKLKRKRRRHFVSRKRLSTFAKPLTFEDACCRFSNWFYYLMRCCSSLEVIMETYLENVMWWWCCNIPEMLFTEILLIFCRSSSDFPSKCNRGYLKEVLKAVCLKTYLIPSCDDKTLKLNKLIPRRKITKI